MKHFCYAALPALFATIGCNPGGSLPITTLDCSKPENQSTTHFAQGAGTEVEPYLVCTPQQFELIEYFPLAHFQLQSDLDFAGFAFRTVCGFANPFQGKFDGNAHSLKNVTVPDIQHSGIFGSLENAEIQNLRVENIYASGSEVGALASRIVDSTISQIRIQGTVKGKRYVGGLAGTVLGGHYSDLQLQMNLTGEQSTGGLAGIAFSSTSGGNVEVQKYGFSGSITSLSAPGASIVGGVFGQSAPLNLYIREAHVQGTIFTPKGGAGGLIGGAGTSSSTLKMSNVRIANSRVDATVTSTGNSAGGLIAFVSGQSGSPLNVSIDTSLATGRVQGAPTAQSGGIVGVIDTAFGYAQSSDSYYAFDRGNPSFGTGQATSAGGNNGEAKTDTELKTLATYNLWSFTTVWKQPTASAYAALVWEDYFGL